MTNLNENSNHFSIFAYNVVIIYFDHDLSLTEAKPLDNCKLKYHDTILILKLSQQTSIYVQNFIITWLLYRQILKKKKLWRVVK